MSELSPEHLAAWRALLVVHATVLRRLEQTHAEHGLIPLEWYDVLVHLSEAPERRLRLSALADAVLLSRSGLTRLVGRMVDAGLVRREACPSDRRGAYAVLTERGAAVLEDTASVHRRGIQECFGRYLSAGESVGLVRLLDRLR